MKNYTIYFEIFGKKMKFTTLADSRNDAINILKNKINIIKIDGVNEGISEGISEGINDDDMLNNLKNLFGIRL